MQVRCANLKERSLEVIRINPGLIEEDAHRPKAQFSFHLDEHALVTPGVCCERVPRLGGTDRVEFAAAEAAAHLIGPSSTVAD